jgi:putative hemolysin
MSWLDNLIDPKGVSEFLSQFMPTTPLKGELRIANLEVRLAQTVEEVTEAQRLRYRVFYQEMGAHATPEQMRSQMDGDRFDAACDHVLVLDHNRVVGEQVVGTYRMLRRSVADQTTGFYTSQEYDIAKLLLHPGELLEVGRSCVDKNYRTRPTLELLWRGIAAYVDQFDVELIFGCASFAGTDPVALKDELAYLYYHHLAPAALRAVALPDRYVAMNAIALDSVNPRRALVKLPPLIKGYLRIGGFIGDGAVIDEQFGTTDVCIIVKTDLITDKHARHYGLTDNEK